MALLQQLKRHITPDKTSDTGHKNAHPWYPFEVNFMAQIVP
jgi:hypothetical protein